MIGPRLILIILIFIHIYLYLLCGLEGEEGIDVASGGISELNGVVSNDKPVLYRFHTGYVNVQLDQESINSGVELYWSQGIIKPLSLLDFNRKPLFNGTLGRSIFSPSHYILVTTNNKTSAIINQIHNNNNKNSNQKNNNQIKYKIKTSINFSDSYGLSHAVYIISIILSTILTLILYYFKGGFSFTLAIPISIVVYNLSNSLFFYRVPSFFKLLDF